MACLIITFACSDSSEKKKITENQQYINEINDDKSIWIDHSPRMRALYDELNATKKRYTHLERNKRINSLEQIYSQIENIDDGYINEKIDLILFWAKRVTEMGRPELALKKLRSLTYPPNKASILSTRNYIILKNELSYLTRIIDQDYNAAYSLARDAYLSTDKYFDLDSLKVLSLIQLSQSIRLQKNYFKSLCIAYEAYRIATNLQSPNLQGYALHAIIASQISFENLQVANSIYGENQEIIEGNNISYRNGISTMKATRASVYGLLDSTKQALKSFQNAFTDCQAIDCYQEDYLWYRYAYFLLGKGKIDETIKSLQTGINVSFKKRTHPDLMPARMYNLLGRCYIKENKVEQAIQSFHACINMESHTDLAASVIPKFAHIEVHENILYYLNNLAQAYKKEWETAQDNDLIHSSLSIYRLMDTLIHNQQGASSELSIAHFSEEFVQYYCDKIDNLLILINDEPKYINECFKAILEGKNQITKNVRAASKLAAENHEHNQWFLEEKGILSATNDFKDHATALTLNYSRLIENFILDTPTDTDRRMQYQSETYTLDTLQRYACRDNKAFLTLFFGQEKYYFLYTSCDTNIVKNLPFDTIENAIEKYLAHLLDPSCEPHSYAESAYNLYQKLFYGINLTSDQLTIYSDGPLARVPFQGLVTSISVKETGFKSLAYLGDVIKLNYGLEPNKRNLPKEDKISIKNGLLLSFSSSETIKQSNSSNYTELADGDDMYDLLSSIYSDASWINFSGSSLTGKNLIKEKSRFDLIHVQTHTSLHPENRNLSGFIVRSSYDPFVYDTIYPFDKENFLSSSELLVLSACSSNIGIYLKGEGHQSLMRSAIQAGSKRVLGSLWDTPDMPSDHLALNFYNDLKISKSPDISIYNAQRTYRHEMPDQLSHPYYWSGLIYIH